MNAALTARSLKCYVKTSRLSPVVRSLCAKLRFNVDRDETALQSKQNQVGVTLQIENVHDVMLMELHSFLAQV